MAAPKHTTRLLALSALLAASALLGACARADTLPEPFLGQWYYTGSSGGIAGTGMGDDPSGYIVITDQNTIESYTEDGTSTGTTSFTPTYGPSIFDPDGDWLLTGGGDLQRAIRVHADGTMTISDNVYDGFSGHYARSR